MKEEWLRVDGLSKTFGGLTALREFSCLVWPGEIVGLIGPNGAGKTTLFNVLTGLMPADRGNAVFQGHSLIGLPPHRIALLGIARTFQELRLVGEASVLDNVLLWFRHQPGEHLANALLRRRNCWHREVANRQAALLLLEQVRLARKATDPAQSLSYGQQKLLSIVCCLASEACLLLLDEPVAGIAPEMTTTVLDTIEKVRSDGKSVILIEHNMDAVMQICSRVLFIDAGSKVAEGPPQAVRNDPRVIEAYLD